MASIRQMQPLLYDELVPFHRLLAPADDHEPEAVAFQEGILCATLG